LAVIIAFNGEKRPSLAEPTPSVDRSEIVIFPRTNIRVLRKMWGLPEKGLLIAGVDGRAIGALSGD
jgi:hypothetical protein